MHSRDFAALVLAALAAHLALSHDGGVALRKAWVLPTPPDDVAAVGGASYVPPAPVVFDLNGDGRPEIVAATPRGELVLATPRPPGRDGDGFAPARVLARLSLRPSGPDVAAGGHRAVALAAGFLDPPPPDARGVRAPRKAFLAVLTSGWRLLVLDHNLGTVWEAALRGVEGLPPDAAVREAALLLTHHPLHDGDRGSVLVVSTIKPGGEAGGDGAGGEEGGEEDAAAYAHAHEATFLALDGRTGAVRWSSGGGGEGEDGASAASASASAASASSSSPDAATLPQHDIRLTAAAAATARNAASRRDCADFRESVLDLMPHTAPDAAGDGPPPRARTRLRLAHFRHDGKAPDPGRRARHVGAVQRAHPGLAAAGKGGRAAGRRNAVARLFARVAARATRGGPARDAPGRADGTAAAITAADAARAWAHAHSANVVVAHTEAGLDVLHLHSGARVCGVRLPSPGTTADVDGDGVLDYVVAVGGGGRAGSGDAGGADGHHAHARACTGVALAGVPPRVPLWNVSLCGGHAGAASGDGGGDDGGAADPGFWRGGGGGGGAAALAVAPPALLRTRDAAGRRTRAHSLVAFLTSRGDVTAVRQDGARAWRARAGAAWHPAPSAHDALHPRPHPAPTLTPFALRTHTPPAAFLVGGDARLALVSEHGRVVAAASLPRPPLLPALPVDADGDGLTDAVVVGDDGVYGFAQTRRPGALPSAALAAVVAVAMCAVWATAGGGVGGGSKRARGTDRDD